MAKGTTNYNPKSLINLSGAWTTETAKAAQKKGVESRKANKAAREQLKLNMKDWKHFQTDVLKEADMSSVDVLKILMFKALDNEDYDTAADLAKSIAEFETPKLSRVESSIKDLTVSELTDDELREKVKELLKDNNS